MWALAQIFVSFVFGSTVKHAHARSLSLSPEKRGGGGENIKGAPTSAGQRFIACGISGTVQVYIVASSFIARTDVTLPADLNAYLIQMETFFHCLLSGKQKQKHAPYVWSVGLMSLETERLPVIELLFLELDPRPACSPPRPRPLAPIFLPSFLPIYRSDASFVKLYCFRVQRL